MKKSAYGPHFVIVVFIALAVAAIARPVNSDDDSPLVTSDSPETTAPSRQEVEHAMRRATRFMTDTVTVNGGYVWTYLEDLSRRWGEMEAKPSMIWTQAPGTPAMGHIFLDAWKVTGKPVFYDAAARAADALIAGQHPSGGWNYVIDFAGEDSLREWYDTIGRNGWRLEEFQHYYGNATFDDGATFESAFLLLRIYLEKRESRFRAALDKAIGFVIESQYPSGGWPQRYPPAPAWSKQEGFPDYTGYVTLNDNVAQNNIRFLMLVLQQLEDERVREPLKRAMDLFIELQQPAPSPGWSLQYTVGLEPVAARTYEPRSVSPHTTAAAVNSLMDFYELTGERKYLEPIAAAIEWLQSIEIPASQQTGEGRNFYPYVEIGSNRYIAYKRRGSNTQNGEYYFDYDMSDQRPRRIDLVGLKGRYGRLLETPPGEATAGSAWYGRGDSLLPRLVVADHFAQNGREAVVGKDQAEKLVEALNEQGFWPSLLAMTSHPYRGPGPAEPPPGFVDRGHVVGRVGDEWDTSPFYAEEPVPGISTIVFIRNMNQLIIYLDNLEDE